MPDELRVQRLDADGNPVGAVALLRIAPGSLRLAIQYAAAQEELAGTFQRVADTVRSWSFTMAANPELFRLLAGYKPRRGWKGHGAPPIYPRRGR